MAINKKPDNNIITLIITKLAVNLKNEIPFFRFTILVPTYVNPNNIHVKIGK
jgi:hypothetical protein